MAQALLTLPSHSTFSLRLMDRYYFEPLFVVRNLLLCSLWTAPANLDTTSIVQDALALLLCFVSN